MSSNALATNKVAALIAGFAVVATAFAFAPVASAQTTTSTCANFTFTRNLKKGARNSEVMQLQKFLNQWADTQIAVAGVGSPGNETSYFGPLTTKAVIKFQEKYTADILTPNGLSKGTGNWYTSTRAKANALCAGTGGNTGGNTGGTVGGNLSVMAAAQPQNSLAPQGAARVPFTTFTLTNSSNAPVTITGVTVQRVGLGVDSVFSGIVLVDSNSIQIGTSKTLNSNHQAVVGDTFTLNAGESRTLTVAGNMGASLSSQAGQVVGLQVVGVNTAAPVSGSLPINGAMHTINATLSLGSVSTSTSAFDPGTTQTKNIGDTGIKFSGIKFTAGSTEDLRLYSIRWRQVGSVSSSDLANIMTVANGTSYPTTVSADGKYYTTTFPGGLLITKGNSLDVYVQGDIVGSNASSRTVDFDIDKVTDVYFVGQLYGYGVAPAGTFTPWYNGNAVTVTGASVTTIQKDTSAANAAQNIAVNVAGQVLGGYVVDLKGEAITVQSQVFTVATTTASSGLLQSVSIYDETGKIVAGPVDATWVSGTQTLTFTDSVTYPTGRHTYTLKGKVPTCTSCNGQTIAISTNPSTGWTNVTGQVTGNSVTISNAAITLNTMTVKSGALAIAVSATPAAQNIVAGGQSVEFARIQLDAQQSGEDVRINNLKLVEGGSDNAFGGAPSKLSNCQIYDGAVALNGGSNVVNPTDASSGTATSTTIDYTGTFTFDNSLVIPKGTMKELSVKCNVASTADASSKFQWGITASQIAALAVTGKDSGATITATGSTNNGQLMTISSGGSVVVSNGDAAPSYMNVAANATGVTVGQFKFRASNEDVNLQRIGLQLTNTASSSAADLVKVTLWYNGTQIGSATFNGSSNYATSTLTSPLLLPKNTDVQIDVKADTTDVGTGMPGTAGHLIAVDVDTNSTNTQGVGVQSSNTINASGSTSMAGVRVMKSYPIVRNDSNSISGNVSGGELMRFKVTASNSGSGINLSKFTLTVSTSTATVTGINVYAYSDANYSQVLTGLRSDGAVTATDKAGTAWASSSTELEFGFQNGSSASTTITVPAGGTRYFKVLGSVSGATSGASITTTLKGDSSYPALAASTFLDTYLNVNNNVGGTNTNNFIWSPNTNGSSAVTTADWTNGYQVDGLPAGGLSVTRSI